MATRGRSARVKGHTFERDIAQFFRDLGWDRCVTSRSESKNLDDLGVDLCYTEPFQVQCKAVENLGLVHDILGTMPIGHNLVFHKKNNKGTVVSMKLDTFKLIVGYLMDGGYMTKEYFNEYITRS